MTTITISSLPNINFYTGEDAESAAHAVENRLYGTHSDYYGDLSLSNANNSYWSNVTNSTFSENTVNYNNIGDILNATISYLNKFKDNHVEININKNILTFNYDYENDLNSDFNNTCIIPSQQLVDLLLNVNDMTFNKRHYYGNNIELKEISYARKKYPYNPDNTIYVVNDENSVGGLKTYDFSRTFTDYHYEEFTYDISYVGQVMQEYTMADGTIGYIPTGQTYTGFNTYYTYQISDINEFKNRVDNFFDDNKNRVENDYQDLKTYYISELDTVLTLSLNTYSLGNKNLYAYFNFNSDYNNWFNNVLSLTMNTTNLNNNDKLLSITPSEESWFNVNINNKENICGSDIKINTKTDFIISDVSNLEENQIFQILNPSHIKELDISENIDKISNLNLISNYNKRINVYDFANTNWMIESNNNINIEKLIIGNSNKECNITSIQGINNIKSLKELDITNCNKLTKDFSISKLNNLEVFKAKGSNIKNFVPKSGNTFITVELPETLKTLTLKNIDINNFDYQPTENLINVTLENVTGNGLNTQQFIKKWVDVLDTNYSEDGDNTLLKDGIVTNTNLTGINWKNYKVEDLLKFKYLGINHFSGTIGIKGSLINGNINRQEYLNLRNVFGDEIMECGIYTSNSKPIKFNYTLDPNAYRKTATLEYYETIGDTEEAFKEEIEGDTTHTFIINDNTGGNSLLDYFDTIESLTLTKNKENFGYEVTLPTTIYTDNNDSSSLTKDLSIGDVVLYKGNKLILVYKSRHTVYNYVKLGKFTFYQQYSNKIKLDFFLNNNTDNFDYYTDDDNYEYIYGSDNNNLNNYLPIDKGYENQYTIAPKEATKINLYNKLTNELIQSKNIDLNNKINEDPLYTIGIISDIHYNDTDANDTDPDTYTDDDSEYSEDLRNALSVFNNENVDFICCNGDISTDYLVHLINYKRCIDKYGNNIPIYTCSGNHDTVIKHNMLYNWKEIDHLNDKYNIIRADDNETSSFYFVKELSDDKKDVFIFLNVDYGWNNDEYYHTHSCKQLESSQFVYKNETETPTENDIHLYDPSTLLWLSNLLEEHKDDRCFIFTHLMFNEYAGSYHGEDGYYKYYENHSDVLKGDQGDFLKQLANKYSNNYWFSGHSHYKWIWEKYDHDINVCKSTNSYHIHIPSLSRPLPSGIVNYYSSVKASEGGIIEIYEDYIVIKGIVFKDEKDNNYINKFLPIAQYKL